METLKLSALIGQEIKDLRFQYIRENEYGLQSFHSYIKLNNEVIISIPTVDDDEYLELNPENIKFFQQNFESGVLVRDSIKKYLVGQKIIDFLFRYFENEHEFATPCYIQLSNEYYLTEINYGPPGLSNIDLIVFNKQDFLNQIKNLKIDLRSFLESNKTFANMGLPQSGPT